MNRLIRAAGIGFFGLFSSVSLAGGVLVVAPHPDDDVIIAAGVTERLRANGENVTVVFVTNGDYGGVSQGTLRQNEAVNAQTQYLRAVESDLIFLGYPDGYLEPIYQSHTTSATALTTAQGVSQTYASRGLGGMDYHQYRFGAHGAYNLPNIVNDLRDIINARRPDQIYTTAEVDAHADHATTYRALKLALAPVLAADPGYAPTLHKAIVHSNNDAVWPGAANPTAYLTQPPNLPSTGLVWANRESLDVQPAMQNSSLGGNPKYLALQAHASQLIGSNFILGFVHKDEVFWSEDPRGLHAPPVVAAGSDVSATSGQNVSLSAAGSFSPSGAPLTFQWRQTAGPLVTLSSSTSSAPSFTAPANLTQPVTLVFELRVSDGTFASPIDQQLVVVSPGAAASVNVAPLATVTASSQNVSTSQLAIRAVDGVADGYPGDYTKEWATQGERAGAWLNLALNRTYTVDRVVLYDRPNTSDQITGGTLRFSDGSVVAFGALNNSGGATAFTFSARATNSVLVTVTSTSGSTGNVGLAEIQVYGSTSGGTTSPPVANAGSAQTVSEGAAVMLNGASSTDPQGYPLTYAWTQTAGNSVTLANANSASPTFTAPTGLGSNATLTFQLVVNNGVVSSQPATVAVTVTASTPAVNVAPLATVTASSQAVSTGQLAIRAVDGVADGYPGDYTKEWATQGERVGAWLNLALNGTYTVDRVVLYDRPNPSDQITGGTLRFSDGSVVTFGALNNTGATAFTFSARATNSVLVTVTSTSGDTFNVGLAEVQVYGSSSGGTPPASPPVANAGSAQTVSEGVVVMLNGASSTDPQGYPLTYAWTQTAGVGVTLFNANSSTPTFVAPTGLGSDATLTFRLVVNNGVVSSQPATATVTVTASTPAVNVAPLATVTASSQNVSTSQLAISAVDGIADGYPGDYTKEWATLGERAGAWLNLALNRTYTVDRVVLYDRPNPSDQITGGTLRFSDGSVVTFGALNNSGATAFTFSARATNSVLVTVTSTSGDTFNVGLSEIQVYGR